MSYIEEYERDGIAVIPGVFTKEEMDWLRASAYSAKVGRNPRYRHKFVENGIMFWPALMDDNLEAFRRDERLANIVRSILGTEVKQLNNQIYFRESDDGDEFAWHQDVRFRQPRNRYPGIQDSYLQTIIVVDDITEDNGAVEFIPGSHTWPEMPHDPLRKFERGSLKGVKYTAKSGDVLIWSVMIVHGSEQNKSGRNRMTYMNGFACREAALDWPHYMVGGKVVDIDPKQIP